MKRENEGGCRPSPHPRSGRKRPPTNASAATSQHWIVSITASWNLLLIWINPKAASAGRRLRIYPARSSTSSRVRCRSDILACGVCKSAVTTGPSLTSCARSWRTTARHCWFCLQRRTNQEQELQQVSAKRRPVSMIFWASPMRKRQGPVHYIPAACWSPSQALFAVGATDIISINVDLRRVLATQGIATTDEGSILDTHCNA